MKKILVFILSAAMMLSFAACNDGQGEETEMTNESTTAAETTANETTKPADATSEETTAPEDMEQDIEVISPENNAKVVLANDDVYGWYKDFRWKKTDSEPFYQHADIYYPIPVAFEWQGVDGAQYYRVYISTNEDMSDAESYLVNETKLEISTLFTGTQYYWQIDAVCAEETVRSSVHTFTTAKSIRAIFVEGVSNTRDAGGYDTVDGGRMKQGMIYRGGKLEGITEKGIETFHDVLGIKTDLDLRTTGEGGAGVSSPLGADVNYVNLDGRYYLGAKGIDSDEGKKIIADEIRVFVDPANYPVYVHCSLGRDRTGTIILILQGLVGVGKNEIMMDYVFSVFSVTGTLDNASISALRNNIDATYHYLNKLPGDTFAESVEYYLLSCGITAEEIQAIRDNLTE